MVAHTPFKRRSEGSNPSGAIDRPVSEEDITGDFESPSAGSSPARGTGVKNVGTYKQHSLRLGDKLRLARVWW